MSRTLHVISISSGKDSLATLLIALENCPASSIRAIFCDTGNEHEEVYTYLDYLEAALGIQITRLKTDFTQQLAAKRMFIARDVRTGRDRKGRKLRWSNKAKRRALAVMYPSGNPFLDLCMWKGRFPSRKAQFCTEELKRNMAVEYQLELMEAGHRVISWQGVRRDESEARRNAKLFERVGGGLWIFRPIVAWSAQQVFDFARSRGIKPNPLYLQNMGRVGCMPCINCRKEEPREIAARWPHHLERIADWEWIVGMCCKRGFSTFFSDSHSARDRREVFADLNVWARVEWSKTSRGGRQFNLLDELENDGSGGCSSSYGLCEQVDHLSASHPPSATAQVRMYDNSIGPPQVDAVVRANFGHDAKIYGRFPE
ncbi:phosphoadenosine phosphosulfate reductase domain-containing protein [Acidovorax delafieldii]|uniref:phosphoadenosine phosphosulfate reductase domain-containing protein n=1 Tax=Acidovorax delafieldii TaxID=47920 RepID=UPI003F4F7902